MSGGVCHIVFTTCGEWDKGPSFSAARRHRHRQAGIRRRRRLPSVDIEGVCEGQARWEWRPRRQGLYNPAYEHDSCGVAMVAGHARPPQPRHRRQGHHRAAEPGAPRCPGRRTEHRRRCGHPAAGARRVPARRRRVRPARAGQLRHRHRVPAAVVQGRRRGVRGRREDRRGRGPARCSAGATCPPTSRRWVRWPATRCRPSARCSSAARPAWTWSAAPTWCASAPSTSSAPRVPGQDGPGRETVYFPSLSGQTFVYKGMLTTPQLQGVLPRPAGRAADQRAGHRALAVLHQHVPVVAAGPPVPADRAQRRDQHRHRQRELDAGARGADQHRRLRRPRRPRQDLPRLHARRLRHRALRRGARTAAPRRPQPAARRADDDPGGVGAQRVDGPRASGVLRVPRLADGAVGRPGVGVLHRRHRDRRGARPQRPAPVADLGHRRRSGGDGVRGRRARPRPVDRRARRCACSPAGCSWSTPRRAASSTTRRSRPNWPPSMPYQEWLDAGLFHARRAAAGRLRPHAAPPGGAAPAGLRLHLRGAQPAGGADGAHRRRGAGLDGHRHPGRRAVGSGRGCSTTTSSSCSPR